MPPQRTISMASKPVKTERSHEENQERAYIAASRRSDRSLEARVESARRASEIHKRRTGRSLRVTEQDVVNEEMYEEEDDDLPAQYRRLTAHLNTTSSDFNRRLASYLTNQVAMRQALSDAMSGNNGQNWNNQFTNNNFMNQSFPQNPTMIPPSMLHQSPSMNPMAWQMPNAQMAQGNMNRQRPASIPTAQPMHASSPPSASINSPMANFNFGPSQMSSNPGSAINGSPVQSHHGQRSNSDSAVDVNAHSQSAKATPLMGSSNNQQHSQFQQQSNAGAQQGGNDFSQASWTGSPSSLATPVSPMAGPLSTQLPMESQQFFHPFDSSEQQPFSYSYNPNFANKKSGGSHLSTGMSQTLAPAAFDSKVEQTAWPTPPTTVDQMSPLNAMGSANFGGDETLFSKDSFHFDGNPTPADEDWNAFFQWGDDQPSSTA